MREKRTIELYTSVKPLRESSFRVYNISVFENTNCFMLEIDLNGVENYEAINGRSSNNVYHNKVVLYNTFKSKINHVSAIDALRINNSYIETLSNSEDLTAHKIVLKNFVSKLVFSDNDFHLKEKLENTNVRNMMYIERSKCIKLILVKNERNI
jgi:hypothetical protein